MKQHLDDTAARARRLLASGPARGGIRATESAAARIGPPGPEDVKAIARQLTHARATSAASIAASGDVDRLAASLVERAQAVMNALENGTPAGSIGDQDALALESVIRTRGRPALAIEGARIEALDSDKHPGSGFWRIPLNDHETQLVRVGVATGAVTARDRNTGDAARVRGTAWLIRSDLVVTNRHVLLPPGGIPLARRHAAGVTSATIRTDYEVMVDFGLDDGPPRAERHLVSAVAYMAEDNDPVDVAVLRIAGAPPGVSPLTLACGPNGSKQIYLFGHPGALKQVPAEVQAVFGTPNGRKRVCFGELMPTESSQAGELVHDASTIGGFSGGCLLTFGSTDVTALHYYGDPVRGNRAIRAEILRAHPMAAFL